ncbi:MAG TPA: hypothetical protein VGO47_08640 [Chlamydiales bacterium]|nr:hypothetical protein [Chlamydiales bacterium]
MMTFLHFLALGQFSGFSDELAQAASDRASAFSSRDEDSDVGVVSGTGSSFLVEIANDFSCGDTGEFVVDDGKFSSSLLMASLTTRCGNPRFT